MNDDDQFSSSIELRTFNSRRSYLELSILISEYFGFI